MPVSSCFFKKYKSIINGRKFAQIAQYGLLPTTINQGFANPILIGDPRKMKSRAKKQNLKIDWGKVKIINPKTSKLTEKYTEAFAEARKGKGLTKAKARKILKSNNRISSSKNTSAKP